MSDKKQLPEGLPPLPEGAVYLGQRGDFKQPEKWYGWYFCVHSLMWLSFENNWRWIKDYEHYAALIGSPIAILNGHTIPQRSLTKEERRFLDGFIEKELSGHSPEIKEEGETQTGDLWKAIHKHVEACNGDHSRFMYGGDARKTADSLGELIQSLERQRDEARKNVESLVCQKEDLLVERDQARRERDEARIIIDQLLDVIGLPEVEVESILDAEMASATELRNARILKKVYNAKSGEALNQKEQ